MYAIRSYYANDRDGDMSKDGDLWYVYMVRCNDGTLYTGIARELKKRLAAHNSDRDGRITSYNVCYTKLLR